MKTYTLKEVVVLGDKLHPEDFSFEWKVTSEEKKPWFFDFGKTTRYHADLRCINVVDPHTKLECEEILHLPEMKSYRSLVESKKAPYQIAAMKAGYSDDMVAPSYSASSLEKLQAKLDKNHVSIDAKSLLNN